MATAPRRGDVWLVDLGMVAKIRPCLVVSIPANHENDRVLTTIIPHTTSTRGSRFEIAIASRFLKTGALDVKSNHDADEMLEIEAGLKVWLGLTD